MFCCCTCTRRLRSASSCSSVCSRTPTPALPCTSRMPAAATQAPPSPLLPPTASSFSSLSWRRSQGYVAWSSRSEPLPNQQPILAELVCTPRAHCSDLGSNPRRAPFISSVDILAVVSMTEGSHQSASQRPPPSIFFTLSPRFPFLDSPLFPFQASPNLDISFLEYCQFCQ